MDLFSQPSTSAADPQFVENTQVLEELRNTQGINIWSETQETLEQQALREIETFAKENNSFATVDVEEGEIAEEEGSIKPEKIVKPTLDINEFIKRQEELKKRQDHAKSLQVSEISKQAAERVTKQKRKHKATAKKAKQKRKSCDSDSDYEPSDGDEESAPKRRKTFDGVKFEKVKDDGSIACYKARLALYYKRLEEEKSVLNRGDDVEEEFCVLKGGLKIPNGIWNNLYSYQQDGVEWLWKIHQNPTGGLLGDEMGLGKTVQIIVFLHALNYSRISIKQSRYVGLGPTLIVCPATVIHQWVQHFHEWAPEFRVAVLHQSGTYTGSKTKLIKEINKDKGILITTYIGVLKFKGLLLDHNWHYVILDEGHKIRNPSAKVSVAVKEFRTPHRIMLTGSPMQNNLQELWSLFDFVVPGMLGSLPAFLEHFANPIVQGGYSNATPMQEATALSVATALKDMITPYMLRRVKSDVKKMISLPNKSEQVLFCSLTDEQRDLYKGFLLSEHVSMILGRGGKNWFAQNQIRANVLVAITTLRKICNHPDLYLNEFNEIENYNEETPVEQRFGYYKRSGKMIVVSALLKIWKKQNHRVLLFTQSRAVILIFEEFLRQQNFKYLKMDGSTSVSLRQPLIDKFNQDNSYFVFLLTTRVGGLGVNLTGANRVIIYDPDWNPATDTQARERAWRIGQEKQVTIYRLLSAGTIEEKMYQRQVWKQLLSNKVLIDPKTQKFFKTSDLHDLFSLQENIDNNPETANIFHNSRVSMQERKTKISDKIEFSQDKIQAMKNLAQQIAKSIAPTIVENKSITKTTDQIEIEGERLKKLQEKEKLKTLSPMELRELNRKKLEKVDDSDINKIDDLDTDVSFSKALEITEKTAQLYSKVKIKNSADKEVEQYSKLVQEVSKSDKTKQKIMDTNGKVDGEIVEGVVKQEIKKHRDKKSEKKILSQDDYVLNKLFSKKGVHTALQHDVIVEGRNSSQNNLKIHYEAKMKADLAMQALRKSRLNNWKW